MANPIEDEYVGVLCMLHRERIAHQAAQVEGQLYAKEHERIVRDTLDSTCT